jgi:hypothetical protein
MDGKIEENVLPSSSIILIVNVCDLVEFGLELKFKNKLSPYISV